MVRFASGYTYREIAESAGVSYAALRKRMERLRSRLQVVADTA